MPIAFVEGKHSLPIQYDIPDFLALEYMVYQMANGDPSKYKFIEKNYDIDDFYLWVAFKNRDAKADEYLRDKK